MLQGIPLPMHNRLYPIARHGTRKVPFNLGNLNDPFLIDFVNYIHHITHPNNQNRPQEIHIVLLGLAGLSVDLTGFGDRTQGFFRFMLAADAANNTNLASNIYIVPLVEEHVMDGVAQSSLSGPGAYNVGLLQPQVAPHPPALFWIGYHNKYLQRIKLRALIDRWEMRRNTLALNQLTNAAHQVPQSFGLQRDEQIDRLTDALWGEMAWRSGWLSNITNPTAGDIEARNVNRNLRMRP